MSANQALLVSEEKLRAFTAVHASVSPTDLTPHILTAQNLVLQEILGSTFYNQLSKQVVNSSLTTVNRTILDDFIGPALCNLAYYYCLPGLTYKVFQKSVLKPGSESSQNIRLDELKYLREVAMDVAESYLKKLQTYLKNNSSLYPAYSQYVLSDGVAPNKESPFFCGIQTSSKYYNKKQRYNYNETESCED